MLTISQLAGLPGLPSSRTGVYKLAEREGWEAHQSPDGVRYPLRCLPPQTRLHLEHPELPTEMVIEGRSLGSAQADAWASARKKARRKAVEAVQALTLFESLRHTGIPAAEVYQRVHDDLGVTERSLRRWKKQVKGHPIEDWAVRLLPKYKTTKAMSEIHPEAWDHFLSDYLRPAEPALTACYRRLVRAAKERPDWGQLPSQQALRRRLAREVPPATLMIRRKGEHALDQCIPAQRRSVADLHAMAHVNADGHKIDVFVEFPNVDPTKKPRVGRAILLAWQDIYSRKILSWRLDETENVDAVRLAFADMVRDYGIPERATIDNGHAFAGKHMTGGLLGSRFRYRFLEEEPDGVYKAFGIEVHPTLPYRGQSKPIERGFRDLCESIARHPLCDGAYTGNSPTTKPANYGERAVPYDVLHKLVEEEIAAHNAQADRRTETAKGRSFEETFWSSYNDEQTVVRKATDAQIRWLLLPIEDVKVSKDEAVITLFGNRFWHSALLDHRGERMLVRFDPHHIHAGLWVFAGSSREPLCKADCIMPVGFADTDSARRDMRARRATLKAQKERASILGTTSPLELATPAAAQRPVDGPARKVVRGHFQSPIATPATKQPTADSGTEMLLSLGRKARADLDKRAPVLDLTRKKWG